MFLQWIPMCLFKKKCSRFILLRPRGEKEMKIYKTILFQYFKLYKYTQVWSYRSLVTSWRWAVKPCFTCLALFEFLKVIMKYFCNLKNHKTERKERNPLGSQE